MSSGSAVEKWTASAKFSTAKIYPLADQPLRLRLGLADAVLRFNRWTSVYNTHLTFSFSSLRLLKLHFRWVLFVKVLIEDSEKWWPKSVADYLNRPAPKCVLCLVDIYLLSIAAILLRRYLRGCLSTNRNINIWAVQKKKQCWNFFLFNLFFFVPEKWGNLYIFCLFCVVMAGAWVTCLTQKI